MQSEILIKLTRKKALTFIEVRLSTPGTLIIYFPIEVLITCFYVKRDFGHLSPGEIHLRLSLVLEWLNPM